MKHVHGGDVYHHQGCVDFSANCNPLGTPGKVRQAVADSLDELVNYPQVGYESLKKAIAEYEQVSKEQVICGNGAAELIYTLILALRRGRPWSWPLRSRNTSRLWKIWDAR